MIDIENQVFTAVRTAVITEYSDAKIESVLNLSPAEFPFVSVEEISNGSVEQSIDSGSNENHGAVTYEINVYSNKIAGRKAEAKSILAIADGVMLELGFVRSMTSPINMNDGTKYRIIARYTAVVSQDEIIFRR